MFRMPAQPGRRSVGDIIQRIGATGVGSLAVIREIQLQRLRVVDHILHNRRKTVGGGIDLRLGLGAEVDRLGIAAALKVEGATLTPAMFVIADQNPRRVRRKRGLAGARKPEEHGRIDRIADRMVGRTMHRHHALFRQQIVQQGENRLLVLAGVSRIPDQNQASVEVERDHRFAARAVPRRVGLERRAVDHRPVRAETGQFGGIGPAQKMPDEQAMPSHFRHHPHVNPVDRIGPGEQILDKIIPALHVAKHIFLQPIKRTRRHRRIVLPPDCVLDRSGADHKLVLRRPPGELPGFTQKRAAQTQLALAPLNGCGDQSRFGQVVIDLPKPRKALIFQPHRRVHAP